MLFRVGLENNMEGRVLAWVLNHPGCFSYGSTAEEAEQNLPGAAQRYIDWMARHERNPWLIPGDLEIQVEETWEVYQITQDYELSEEGFEVNAWFLHDWKPLTKEEIERGLKMLSWSRADLLATVKDLKSEELERRFPHERWNIAGILKHIGGAEWWYLDRLGMAFPRPEVPVDPFERLEKVRAHLMEILPGLADSRQVVGIDGEFWSPRKLVRRAIWHELDHIEHIDKILKSFTKG
jgi:predicted RNase H-like HicB family nuclease